jgi:hypothetical protein
MVGSDLRIANACSQWWSQEHQQAEANRKSRGTSHDGLPLVSFPGVDIIHGKFDLFQIAVENS